MARRNEDVAELFENIARLLTIKGDAGYRIRAYRDAAQSIAGLPEDVEQLWSENRLQEIWGVGPALARRIVEFREKRHGFRRVEELLAVPGISEKKWKGIRDKVEVK